MENTQWPSKEKLKELRDQGSFPYSIFAVRSSAAIALMITLFLMRGKFQALTDLLHKILAEPTTNIVAVKARIPEVLEQLQGITIISALVVVIFSLLAVLIQSKFFFSFINLSFDLTQIVPFRKSTLKRLLSALFISIVGLCMAVGFGALFCYWGFQDIWQIVLSQQYAPKFNTFFKTPGASIGALIGLWCLSLLALGVLSYLAARISFMMNNKVTKEEADWAE